MSDRHVFIGYDPREEAAYRVAEHSITQHLTRPIPVQSIKLPIVRQAGLYTRPTSMRNTRLWDDISGAPMSTEFAISRFLTPLLARSGWALFMDCDMLVRIDLNVLFDLAEAHADKALYCVHHNYAPAEAVKMDGQAQTRYFRKNWSSVMLFNVDHPANKALTPEVINSLPGRDLHRFCWLADFEIGELGVEWNYLVGHHNRLLAHNPCIVHFTSGGPWWPEYATVEYADEWLRALRESTGGVDR